MEYDKKEINKDFNEGLILLKSDFPEQKFMPVETFLQVVKPQLVRKSSELAQTRKKRLELLLLAAAYLVTLIILPCMIIDFAVNGLSGMTGKYLLLMSGFVMLMACCLPLLFHFLRKNEKGLN